MTVLFIVFICFYLSKLLASRLKLILEATITIESEVNTMTTADSRDATEKHKTFHINKVDTSVPVNWLKHGYADMKKALLPSLLYGFVFALIGLVLIFIASKTPVWSAALTTSFLLIGPFIAIGLYDLSRQIEAGEKPDLLSSVKNIRHNLVNLGIFAAVLGFLLMIWLRIAALIASVYFNDIEIITKGWTVLFDGERSVEFILFFIVFGFFIALVAFSISVVSIPMLLHRQVDVITAITTSLRVVMKSPLALTLWAGIIVTLIGAGMLLGFIGLTVTLPIIGYASWHAYRDLVSDNP